MAGVWVLIALLVFTLFAFIVVDTAHENTNRKLRKTNADLLAQNARLLGERFDADALSIRQARRAIELRARVEGLEFTVAQMSEAAANQLGEPIYDEMAVARLKRELNEYGWGGPA